MKAFSWLTVTEREIVVNALQKSERVIHEATLQSTSYTKKGLTNMVANPFNENAFRGAGRRNRTTDFYSKKLNHFSYP